MTSHVVRATVLTLAALALVGASGLGHAEGPRPVLATDRGPAELLWVMVDVTVHGLQGDAHLIVGPDHTVLIDAGEYASARERLLPLLARLRVERIDTVLITHLHFDHMGGVLALLEADIPIGVIHMHATVTPERCLKEAWGCRWHEIEAIRAHAQARGIPVRGWSDWTETGFAGSGRLVKIVAFEPGDCPVACDLNDTSLIARLDVRGHRVLFTGDLNRPLGYWLVGHKATEIQAGFLKVPHHGTESTASFHFLRAVAPRHSFVPSPTSLWCSDRSERMRSDLQALSDDIYVNGPHGDVYTYFFADGSYAIKASRPAPEICSAR